MPVYATEPNYKKNKTVNTMQEELNIGSQTYSFAVDVISFGKYLTKMSIETPYSVELLNVAAEISDLGLDLADAATVHEKHDLAAQCEKLAQRALVLLQHIDCKDKLIDEKTNLVIDAAKLAKKYTAIKNKTQ